MKKAITVIIPAYNAEKTIKRCVNSVLGQSLTNIEIIIVNDGSTDMTTQILDDLSMNDSRLIVVNQKNGGVSKARNVGITMATAEWIYFIDSDDWIEPDYLSNFLKDSGNSELIIQGFTKEFDDGSKQNVIFDNADNISSSEIIKLLQYKRNAHNGYLWHKLFRKDIISNANIKFREDSSFAEDGLFFFEYMKHVQCSSTRNTLGHHYMISKTSLTTKRYNVDFYLSMAKDYYDSLLAINNRKSFHDFVRYYVCNLLFYWILKPAYAQKDNYSITKVVSFMKSNMLHFLFINTIMIRYASKSCLFANLFVFFVEKSNNIIKRIK